MSPWLTWNIFLPHFAEESGVMALSLLLIWTRGLVHAQEGQRQSHSRMTLQHVGAVVADGVESQRARRLVNGFCRREEKNLMKTS